MSAARQHRFSGSQGNRKGVRAVTSIGSPSVSDDDRLDADTILVAELRGQSRQASAPQVKAHLKREAETVLTRPGNGHVYANNRGYGILASMEHMQIQLEEMKRDSDSKKRDSDSRIKAMKRDSDSQIQRLENESQESKNKIAAQDQIVLDLEGRVRNLTLVSDGYKDIRRRFLDNYNKIIKHNPEYLKTPAIEKGNLRAHGGDVLVDATLFRDGERKGDPDTFKELYGVDHDKALQYGDDRVYRVMNTRATRVVQKHPFPSPLEVAFKDYLHAVDKKEGEGRAVNNFWKIYNKEYY